MRHDEIRGRYFPVLFRHLYAEHAELSENFMRTLLVAGLVLLIVGVGSFFVPVPHREDHSIKVGDARIGVETQHNEGVPRGVSIVLVVAGVALSIAGARH